MIHPGSPFWAPSPALQRHLNRTATGRPDWDWLTRVRAEFLPPNVARVLVLGGGSDYLERALLRYDGIGTVRILDPERDPLPDGPWNLILAADFLHHAKDVEPLLVEAGRALAPRGRFVFHEYTGPNRFQHPEERMAIVRRYFPLLPDRIRADPATGEILWRRERTDPDRLARELPFEAASSEALLPLARRIFVSEAELPCGGGLLHPLFSGLVCAPRAEDEPLFEVLGAAEAHLTANGLLAPLFTVFVGAPRR
jgi:SAM-dependent methyltransferase